MRHVIFALFFATSSTRGDEGVLRYLPSDTKLVVTIHVNRLSTADRQRGQGLLREIYQTHLCSTLGKNDSLPIRDVEEFVIGLPYAGTFNGVILIRGKIDHKGFIEQMDKAALVRGPVSKDSEGKPLATVYRCKLDDKALVELVPALGKVPSSLRKLVAPGEVRVTLLDDKTVMASLAGAAPVTRALRARPVNSALRISSEMARLLRKPHATALASVVLMDDSLHPGLQLIADEATKETFEQFEFIRMNITGGKKVGVETVVSGKSEEVGEILEKKTKRVLEIIQKELPNVMQDTTRRTVIGELVQSFRIERKEGRVRLYGEIPEANAKKLVEGGKKDGQSGER